MIANPLEVGYNGDINLLITMKKIPYKKKCILILVVFAAASAAVFYYWYIKSATNDKTFDLAMKKIAEIKSYGQHIETETAMSDRQLKVVGDYSVNNEENRFQSKSTTILVIPENNTRLSFTYENISIGNEIFLMVDSGDESPTIPKTTGWLRFSADNIPNDYTSIAVAGPVMDNLRLFSKNGKYVRILEKHDETMENEDFWRYTLSLSEDAFKNDGLKILGVLMERIGKNGTINVWIDKNNLTIKQIKIENLPYQSTTRISNINSITSINPPI